MSYNPSVKLYYIPSDQTISDLYRIVPAPQIAINPEIHYANNIAIGYTYNITLSGYAVSLDLRNPDPSPGFSTTLESIQNIKNLFLINNGILIITNNGTEVLRARGGITKTINFQDSNNNWVNYCPYNIEIEFNELLMSDCSSMPNFNCNIIPSGIVESPYLVDMKKYKIKSFNDDWSISLDDNIYSNYSGISNQYFDIEYKITATGKHYFNTSNALLPAWEQAKNFCQNRLHTQISELTSNSLDCEPEDGCINGKQLSNVFETSSNGILRDIDIEDDYGIFNETITCDASESDGSFTLLYTALIKKIGDATNCFHNFTIDKNITDNDDSKNIIFNVKGSIQGLIKGGLIQGDSVLIFPSGGTLLIDNSASSVGNSRYSQAYSYYNSIGNNKKLNDIFVQQKFNINYLSIGITGCPEANGVPTPTSFFLTHDYINGIISYEISYDKNKILNTLNNGSPITTYSLTIEEPVPIIAEFIIPGRSGGPIVQLLDIETPRKYSLSVEGMEQPPSFCNSLDISKSVSGACSGTFEIDSTAIPSLDFSSMFLIEEKYNKSSKGNYQLTRTYIEYE